MLIETLNQKFSTNESVTFSETIPGFPVLEVSNQTAQASISLYGAHLLSFQPQTQAEPVLWLSDKALFKNGKAIRGGVPVCWPWFGDNEFDSEFPAHGFARTTLWEVYSITSLSNNETSIELQMPCEQTCQQFQQKYCEFQFDLILRITVGKHLKLELITTNKSSKAFTLTEALHTYFNISDIDKVSVMGLESVNYLDKLQAYKSFDQQGAIILTEEIDRVYQNTEKKIVLQDNGFDRKINISKSGSLSTVIWNPWQQKSFTMSDMSDNGWRHMLCVEAANVGNCAVHLNPGQSHTLAMKIDVC